MISVSSKIQLKAITGDDQNELMRIMHQIYPPEYKHLWINEDCNWYLEHCFSKENLDAELREKNAVYYFVFYNSERIGILRLIYNTSIHVSDKKIATFIHRIYLSRTAQGKGIAKQLFGWLTEQARHRGNSILWLKAMDTQSQALRFYEKEGYQLIDTLRLNFERIHPELRGMVIMKKSI